MEADLVEIIKYGSKIFTEPDVNKKMVCKGSGDIYAAVLYTIFDAMKGLRIFERLGFDLPGVNQSTHETRVVSQYYEWLFVPEFHDWLNTENELTLTGYVPKSELLNLLEHNINITQK